MAALQILIFPPPLGRGYRLERLAGLELTSEYLHQFLPVGPNPSPVPDQAHGPEQVTLDHEAVEAPDPLLRVDPVQDQVVLDRGAEFVRRCHVNPDLRSSGVDGLA